MFKLGFRKSRGTRNQIANIHWIIEKAREFQKNIYFYFIDYAKAFKCMDHKKLWKILKEMRIPAATPLSEVMFTLGKRGTGRIAEWFFAIGQEMELSDGRSLAEIVRQTGYVKLQKTVLTKQDKEQLFRLGDSLGRLDKTQQLLATEYYLKGLQGEIEEAKKIKKERSYLYRCLSILTGVFLMILML